MKKIICHTLLFTIGIASYLPTSVLAQTGDLHLRVNQVGYLPDDFKIAMAFTDRQQDLSFELVDTETGELVWGPQQTGADAGSYGNFSHHYPLDFSSFEGEGRFNIRITDTEQTSLPFHIGSNAYSGLHEEALKYIRRQRCGYNPVLDQVCHTHDGRSFYGPVPDSTFFDVSGGWHNAADYLRYMLISGNTIGRMLFTYREMENKQIFRDQYNRLGQPGSNGIPDILDEAKWGLDWMLKMHPSSDLLFHQVADDRDHIGFKLPYVDSSDYGWGPDSYRSVYYANGQPQGLGRHTNTSTGIANLTGRYAAVMAMAADIWANDLNDPASAEQFLKAAKEVYEMGLQQPGSQEGTPPPGQLSLS